ncbi:MAG: hypothetical protein JSS94_07435 [Bacteroidetes bacterium]|jgi:hypothetical protein|nr:hypothetical protein [Bacteroidota bacterium]
MKSISNPKAPKNQDNTPKYSEMEWARIAQKLRVWALIEYECYQQKMKKK